MIFGPKVVTLKDGRKAILRSPSVLDAEDLIAYLKATSSETEYMIRYPEEVNFTLEEEQEILSQSLKEKRRIMISAIVDGKIVGNAGLSCIDEKIKLRHRAGIGIAVLKEAWNLGIGTAILQEMLAIAGYMEYEQLELEVAESNGKAIALYRKMGFVEYGKRDRGFRFKDGSYENDILMYRQL